MREESHLDEMRDAIRGDFERLAARRGEQELTRLTEQEPPPDEPEPDQPEEQPEEQEVVDTEPEPAPRRRSWLGRMFST